MRQAKNQLEDAALLRTRPSNNIPSNNSRPVISRAPPSPSPLSHLLVEVLQVVGAKVLLNVLGKVPGKGVWWWWEQTGLMRLLQHAHHVHLGKRGQGLFRPGGRSGSSSHFTGSDHTRSFCGSISNRDPPKTPELSCEDAVAPAVLPAPPPHLLYFSGSSSSISSMYSATWPP